jgi:glycerol-3-phosphate O-acyltransferase / dihydroxyacetone phosphate acyltransferase
MKEVWVTAPSYEELSLVFLARRVFRPDESRDNPSLVMEMNIKFAKGYKYINEKYPGSEEMKRTVEAANEYMKSLKLLGVNDAYVRKSKPSKITFIVNTVITLVRIVISLFLVRNRQSLPTWIIAGVLGSLIMKKAEQERQKALAGSSVKIHGWDVLASFKIIYGFSFFIGFSIILAILVFFYASCKD